MITSDDWGSYGREVPKDKHLTGKIFTQRIERNNLTLRTGRDADLVVMVDCQIPSDDLIVHFF